MAFCKLAESFWMEQEEKASRDKEHMGSRLLYCSFNAFRTVPRRAVPLLRITIV